MVDVWTWVDRTDPDGYLGFLDDDYDEDDWDDVEWQDDDDQEWDEEWEDDWEDEEWEEDDEDSFARYAPPGVRG